MKKHHRKNVYWGSGLFAYALAIALVFSLLLDSGAGWLPPVGKDPYKGFSGILLPLGPGDGRLPGLAPIWKEFLRGAAADPVSRDADGFDGLQAVADPADLSKGSVAELFLSGTPSQLFRRGRFLLLLNAHGMVQVIDSHNPREPTMPSLLPYQRVNGMEMQGNLAYLHLSKPGEWQDQLVIADLSNPLKPREITTLKLPKDTKSFLLLDHQLVVYTNTRGFQGEHFIHLYDFDDDFQLIPLGSIESPLLMDGFLKYGDYLLAPDALAGLKVYDFSHPLQPVVVASLDFPGRVKRFARHGVMVFAQGVSNRLYAIDLHDPLLPVLSAVAEEANLPAFFVNVDRYTYYFTQKGYLHVFDGLPSAYTVSGEPWPVGTPGELVANQTGGGFTLLGNARDSLPASITDVLTLPGQSTVADQLFWQGALVVLGEDGLVRFFRKGQGGSLEFQESLQLPPAQRWLAAAKDRLYIGGEAGISVVAKGDDGHFILSDHLELPGKESWDGLVVGQTLCVAAGKAGVLCFSLERQDQPTVNPGWTIPPQLEPLVDVRQLATPGDGRLLAAAGAAGLVSARIADDGQLLFEGAFAFPTPCYALAVVADLCLVSTGTDIRVIDTRTRGSLQNLGRIDFPGVERFAVAAPGFWAGFVPGAGWFTLPAPHLVSPGKTEILDTAHSTTLPESRQGRYRLNLFNDREVVTVPGVLSLSSLPESGRQE